MFADNPLGARVFIAHIQESCKNMRKTLSALSQRLSLLMG